MKLGLYLRFRIELYVLSLQVLLALKKFTVHKYFYEQTHWEDIVALTLPPKFHGKTRKTSCVCEFPFMWTAYSILFPLGYANGTKSSGFPPHLKIILYCAISHTTLMLLLLLSYINTLLAIFVLEISIQVFSLKPVSIFCLPSILHRIVTPLIEKPNFSLIN